MGIVFSDDKMDIFRRRLNDVLRMTGFDSCSALYDGLADPRASQLHLMVSQAMTINYTSFFREAENLERLFSVELPHAGAETVRVWSAACSTGEEAYSLAMLARERFGPLAAQKMAFLATDISARAITSATAGRYRPTSVASMGAERLERFFTQQDDHFVANDCLRKLITFRRLNLAVGYWPFKRSFHAVYCRNVLYYFDQDLRRRIAERLFENVIDGGWLFTSVTEALRSLDTSWTYIQPGVYRKS